MYFVTTKTSAHTDGSLIRVLAGPVESRTEVRTLAASLGGTVRTQVELDKLIEAGRLYVEPPAKKAKKAKPAKTTDTSRAEALEEEIEMACGLIDQLRPGTEAMAERGWKVKLVKQMAAAPLPSTGTGHFRRVALLRAFERFPELGVAPATVSTQTQLVRSGKAA